MELFLALLVLGVSSVLAVLLTPLAGKLGQRWGLRAEPGGRRKHTAAVPITGGVALFLAFFGVAVSLYLFAPLRPEHRLPLKGVLLGLAFVFLCGLADDRFEFKSGPQFAVQFIAALIAISTTVFIEQITVPGFGPTNFAEWGWAGRWLVTYPLTIFWVMGMMNTVNWLDGMDGLAAGVSAIAATLFAIHSFILQQPQIAWYALALAGACVGFLLFNFHPARIFLGSSGAMVLGFALATLSILAPARVATALLVMAIPITDTAFRIFDRWRQGRSPLHGDRGHLHFLLLDRGYSHRAIVLGYWLFCAVFGALALLISAPIYKLVAMSALMALVLAMLIFLSRPAK